MRARLVGTLLLLGVLRVSSAEASTLVLTSEPAGAAVSIGGTAAGVTPCSVSVPDTQIGAVALLFRLEGYVPVAIEVSVAPQREYTLKATLIPLTAVGPGGASVSPQGGSGGVEPRESRSESVARLIGEALRRFQTDCQAWPAALVDLTVLTPDALSARVNAAGERIAGGGFQGPYLDALPIDPATGQADWLYDSATGRVVSRLAVAPAARLEGRAIGHSSPVAVEDWLACFQQVTGVRYTPSPTGAAPAGPQPPALSGPAVEWRPL